MQLTGVDIILKRQPRNSYVCGQYCIAMVTHGDVERAVKAVGHEYRTRWPDLITSLRHIGVAVAPRAVIISGAHPKPKQCIVRVKSKLYPAWSHFVVYSHGLWWDPACGNHSEPSLKRHPLWNDDMYQASYLELFGYLPHYKVPAPQLPKPLQPTIYAGDWDKMDWQEKDKIVERVFGFRGCVVSLGQGWQIVREMTKRGFNVEWPVRNGSGFYCMLRAENQETAVGYGRSLSESVCAAALSATGFLLQKRPKVPKFSTHESKANDETEIHTRKGLDSFAPDPTSAA